MNKKFATLAFLSVCTVIAAWYPLTEGDWTQVYVTGEDYVHCLEVYGGKLYVGTGDWGVVYEYDGENWEVAFDPPEGGVTAMAVYEENLFIATRDPGRIYTFDGNIWTLSYNTGKQAVMSLGAYNGKLYAGAGYYYQMLVFDGSSWAVAHETNDYYPYSLGVFENALYVGTTPYGKVYRYDGNSWVLARDLPESGVLSLCVFENKLYLGTGGDGKIYMYDGENWTVVFEYVEATIRALAEYGGLLYAGASDYAGTIHRSEAGVWSQVFDTLQEEVNALGTYGAKLYAGCGYKGIIFSFTEFDFSLSASPDSLQLEREESKTSTIVVDLVSGVTDNVSLRGEWIPKAPADVTAEFAAVKREPPFTASVLFTTSVTALSGTYTYRVTGAWEDVSKSVDITVGVTAPPIAPMLFSPGNGTVLDDLTPALDWEDTPGAESYTLELATDNRFTYVIWTTTTTESQVETEPQLSYGTTYYWRVRAVNQYGVGEWSDRWSFALFSVPPKVVSLIVEGGVTYVSATTVELQISAQRVAEISFSSDGIIWSEWEPFGPAKTYELSPGDGEKSIYVRVRDNEGRVSLSKRVSVILDGTPPSTTHAVQGSLTPWGYEGTAVIQLTAVDVTSGIARTHYRIDGGEWKTGDTVLVSEMGLHEVEYYSVDLAGNEEQKKLVRVEIYVPEALPAYLWAALAIVLGGGIGGFYVWHRGKPARRLREIGAERRELERMKRKTERDYFELGRTSRETYDSFIRRYKERMAELEREERLLRRKMKKREG
jgi:hypothetical protein